MIKLDSMFPLPVREAGSLAANLEEMGFAGIWTTETPHDPYLPLAAAAAATDRISLGTGIATAFTRSPMVTALLAWDLQRASAGRFVLGLGTQVKVHNARRYSTPVESPGKQLRELIAALRHVWGAFQGIHRLDFKGDFYHLDLLADFHSPGPSDHPEIPIYLAAVGQYTYQVAGELAQGVHVHSFHHVDLLREVSMPALEQGLSAAGRRRDELELTCALFAVVGENPRMDRAVRSQIAFYGSTSSYRPILARCGREGLTDTLRDMVRSGNIDGMVAAVDDELLEQLAIIAPSWREAIGQARQRYAGLLDRIGFYGLHGVTEFEEAAEIAAAFRSA